MERLEQIKKAIEKEKDFEKVVELFAEAAKLIKETLSKTSKAKGKLLEIVRDLDEYIEKEFKLGEQC